MIMFLHFLLVRSQTELLLLSAMANLYPAQLAWTYFTEKVLLIITNSLEKIYISHDQKI